MRTRWNATQRCCAASWARWRAAIARLRRDEKPALDALLDANPELDRKLQRAVLRETLPLFSPPRGEPYGWQDPKQWRAFAKWMRDNGLVKQPGLDHGAFDNSLLPGQAH